MDKILDHLTISIFGSMIGILLGLGVVLGLGNLTKGIRKKYLPNRYLVFIPWRTIALAILLFNHFPAYLLFVFGLGVKLGIASSSIYFFILSAIVAYDSFIKRDYRDHIHRVIAISRTFLVFSILLTYNFGMFGGGGLGFATITNLRLLDYGRSLELFLYMVLLGFCIDIIIGSIQFFYVRETDSKSNT